MTLQQIKKELCEKENRRMKSQICYLLKVRFSFQDLSDEFKESKATLRNISLGRPHRKKHEDLPETVAEMYKLVKNNEITAPARDLLPATEIHKKSKKQIAAKPRIRRYSHADNVLPTSLMRTMSRQIEEILLHGASYGWIAQRVGSLNHTIHRLHLQNWFEPLDFEKRTLQALYEGVVSNEIVPPVSKRSPQLHPTIYKNCHRQLAELTKYLSVVDLAKALKVNPNSIRYFLEGENVKFPRPAQVAELYKQMVQTKSTQDIPALNHLASNRKAA